MKTILNQKIAINNSKVIFNEFGHIFIYFKKLYNEYYKSDIVIINEVDYDSYILTTKSQFEISILFKHTYKELLNIFTIFNDNLQNDTILCYKEKLKKNTYESLIKYLENFKELNTLNKMIPTKNIENIKNNLEKINNIMKSEKIKEKK